MRGVAASAQLSDTEKVWETRKRSQTGQNQMNQANRKRLKANRQQWIRAISSAVALLTGTLIYICFRPTSLLMFSWLKAAGVEEELRIAREVMLTPASTTPDWIIFSAPYALWVFSCMLAQQVIWHRSAGIQRFAWTMVAPIIAIASEAAQWLGVIPGAFDKTDVFLVALFTLAGIVAGYPDAAKHVAAEIKAFTVSLSACPVLRPRRGKR